MAAVCLYAMSAIPLSISIVVGCMKCFLPEDKKLSDEKLTIQHIKNAPIKPPRRKKCRKISKISSETSIQANNVCCKTCRNNGRFTEIKDNTSINNNSCELANSQVISLSDEVKENIIFAPVEKCSTFYGESDGIVIQRPYRKLFIINLIKSHQPDCRLGYSSDNETSYLTLPKISYRMIDQVRNRAYKSTSMKTCCKMNKFHKYIHFLLEKGTKFKTILGKIFSFRK